MHCEILKHGDLKFVTHVYQNLGTSFMDSECMYVALFDMHYLAGLENLSF